MATITIADALRMAMRLERENYGEYKKHAAEAASPGARAMFTFLAKEEERHIELIRAKMAEHKVSE